MHDIPASVFNFFCFPSHVMVFDSGCMGIEKDY